MIDNPLVKKAYEFSKISLAGRKRYSGELFADHCLKVAQVLEDFDVKDPEILAVAILHHSIDTGAATFDDVEKEFGKEISATLKILDDLKIIDKIDTTYYAESLRKMVMVLAKDLRIVLIKLADIFDNLRTLKYVPKTRRLAIGKQTLDIFAPLLERLGMGELKGKMQDLAFPFVYPSEYSNTEKLLTEALKNLSKKSIKIKSVVNLNLKKEKISFRVESRSKHLYSLYLKLKRVDINFNISKVYDLIAFRIVVKNIGDCYRVLGIIHNTFRPMSQRLRDYIATPKPNGYRSIHTTVFGPEGIPFEIQIRTEEMHEQAEYGVAAHWHYDEVKSKVLSSVDLNKSLVMDQDKMEWVKQLGKWQEEITDNKEFLKRIKIDFFGQRIFVLTPKGNIKDLPKGATPIDFAYTVHTYLGDKAMGAKVNGKLTSLDKKLESGDMVEILVSKDQHKKPSRDWLKYVVTSLARKKIKKAINV